MEFLFFMLLILGLSFGILFLTALLGIPAICRKCTRYTEGTHLKTEFVSDGKDGTGDIRYWFSYELEGTRYESFSLFTEDLKPGSAPGGTYVLWLNPQKPTEFVQAEEKSKLRAYTIYLKLFRLCCLLAL